MKNLKIHKFPFKNVIVLAIDRQTDHVLRREENKVEFLDGRFLDEKLPFLRKKKAEHSFELSISIFCLIRVSAILLKMDIRH